MIRESEDLPDAVLGIGTWKVRYPPKDQVNQGAILRAFCSRDFFLPAGLDIFRLSLQ